MVWIGWDKTDYYFLRWREIHTPSSRLGLALHYLLAPLALTLSSLLLSDPFVQAICRVSGRVLLPSASPPVPSFDMRKTSGALVPVLWPGCISPSRILLLWGEWRAGCQPDGAKPTSCPGIIYVLGLGGTHRRSLAVGEITCAPDALASREDVFMVGDQSGTVGVWDFGFGVWAVYETAHRASN
jgi:hypothetical protein